jgi:hypothetical protein
MVDVLARHRVAYVTFDAKLALTRHTMLLYWRFQVLVLNIESKGHLIIFGVNWPHE